MAPPISNNNDLKEELQQEISFDINKFNLNEIREEHEDFGIGCNIIDGNIKMIND